ncbi:hypothetical protein [Clostridium sp. ZS2-4]|uniref:hypothetical protein n=1 Tax=Clostridium sp. ZS2-4 TaxID=2987703 RepID=UPI00227A4C5C|nr:hypothetical protein [Clostridium sp. ZS2-4]MCY6356057.1 hypothetical protein [Clostridium sp. ZS2-4]
MKSSKEDLRKRGMIDQSDIDKIMSLSYSKLMELVNAKSPTERSAAIHLLSYKVSCDDEDFIEALLMRLSIEKSLYTKIEICNALENGKVKAARQMAEYLGCIGNNQHKCLPDKVSKKISYPLPRDIIARSLAKMDRAILPVLLEVLRSENEIKISEVIDAIGFLVFYHQELATIEVLNCLIDVMNTYSNNDVVVWKCVLCLSAFPMQKSIDILNCISEKDDNNLIKYEALRSLNLIRIRKYI